MVSEKKIFEKIANEDEDADEDEDDEDEDNAGHQPMTIAHGLSPGELKIGD